MKMKINGESCDISCRTLAELLSFLGHEPDQVATAVNGTFVPASERDKYLLSSDDAVDVIAPMAGG